MGTASDDSVFLIAAAVFMSWSIGCFVYYIAPEFYSTALVAAIVAFDILVVSLYTLFKWASTYRGFWNLIITEVIELPNGKYEVIAKDKGCNIYWKFQMKEKLKVGDDYQFVTRYKRKIHAAYVLHPTNGGMLRVMHPKYWIGETHGE